MSDQPGATPPGVPRVLAVYDEAGNFTGFVDPDAGNRPLSTSQAVRRMGFLTDLGVLTDSFGNRVSILALGFNADYNFARTVYAAEYGYEIREGQLSYVRHMKFVDMEHIVIIGDPSKVPVGENQYITERTYVITRDGRVEVVTLSTKMGEQYLPGHAGGAWRRGVSEAIGLKPDERLKTRELKNFVIKTEYILTTVTRR